MQMLSGRKKDGMWKELTCEALLYAKTCLEPVRIYICYVFILTPLLGRFCLSLEGR